MKKKLFSILLAFFMFFPSIFFVACNKPAQKVAGAYYEVSITLKGAENKIETGSLTKVFDVYKRENVNWKKEGSDYVISFNKTGQFSGTLKFNVLEGIDYSNLSFSVNGENQNCYVKNGNSENCAADGYLTDRYFEYSYNVEAETNFVVDFEGCSKCQVSIDVAALKNNNVRYFSVEDDFVTLQSGAEIIEYEIDSNQMVVDYGTILAFDSGREITYTVGSEISALNKSVYGGKNFIKQNQIQFLTVKQSGVFGLNQRQSSTSQMTGCIKMLDFPGINIASSETDFENENFINNFQTVTETYDGEKFDFKLLTDELMYIELTDESTMYDYFVVENIDDELDLEEGGLPKYFYDTGNGHRTYMILSLQPGETKYLIRYASFTTQYYAVAFDEIADEVKVQNYGYATFGYANRQESVPDSIKSKVIYYFRNGDGLYGVSRVGLNVQPVGIDPVTSAQLKISSLNLNVTNWEAEKNGNPLRIDTYSHSIGNVAETKETLVYDRINHQDDWLYGNDFYSIKMTKIINNPNAIVTIDASEAYNDLQEGEIIYYAKGSIQGEWHVLAENDVITTSNREEDKIYYYIKSNRSVELRIYNNLSSLVSVTGALRDCFNREYTGKVVVDNFEIDLSAVSFLTVNAGMYDAFSATLKLVG